MIIIDPNLYGIKPEENTAGQLGLPSLLLDPTQNTLNPIMNPKG